MDNVNPPQLRLTALAVSDLVKLLKHAGSRYASEDTVQKDIESGAPVNSDETINLIHYAAWLVKETHNADN